MAGPNTPPGVEIVRPQVPGAEQILTPEALTLVADLHRRFGATRGDLLARRAARQRELSTGADPDFLPETSGIRLGQWQVAPPAPGLVDRRVEITGPTDRKMTINALNSGAKVWLADFEDANTPLWENMISGQLNLRDALAGTISFTSPEGRAYTLAATATTSPTGATGASTTTTTIVVRPRGWHLDEKHLLVDGEPVAGAIVDFALYAVHCGRRQLDAGSGPYYYLPKTESHLEARLWNDIFTHTEDALGFPRGAIRGTVLIETILAAFEMEEILYELREHCAGLNAGRWDYLFSIIKKFRDRGEAFTLPDRNAVTMAAPFMTAYAELLVRTCHRRGAHAIGGMAAFIPSRRDPAVNATALAKVREDKTREAGIGFDGSWVAHPDLVPVCREVFDGVLGDRPNQISRTREDVTVDAAALIDLTTTPGSPTLAGLRNNVSVALQYLRAWLAGSGAVAIFNLMEDAATAEISRSQIWQWLHNGVVLVGDSGVADVPVTRELVERVVAEELEVLRAALGESYDADGFARARDLFVEVALADDFADFLTVPAYQRMP
ncbi:malate synthase A [Frankia sp. CcI49]|uniref:malate synthase A n=1 Tax=Frankia sp. CcI49 TaxID=1745382 RepID=UPI000975EF4E|nr:malate synthase A [Frankia sp. CcI49]ONH59223.1 malate synthase A [Frankia sp. CcI49]